MLGSGLLKFPVMLTRGEPYEHPAFTLFAFFLPPLLLFWPPLLRYPFVLAGF